jgi:nucleoid DNA-binding protein
MAPRSSRASDVPSPWPISLPDGYDGGSMNRRDIAKAVSNTTDVPFETVDQVLAATVKVIDLALRAGERVAWRGLGTWKPIQLKAMVKALPASKGKVLVPARRSVRFEPAQKLLDDLNGKQNGRFSL